ncbi:hypothetical protein U0070_013049 [Myodes glareolus]|uniref:Uncharacterized protein n=1 Tax=Myodes glareolus TaxID=447135 RepID=A0AAW0IVT4_MYOGA
MRHLTAKGSGAKCLFDRCPLQLASYGKTKSYTCRRMAAIQTSKSMMFKAGIFPLILTAFSKIAVYRTLHPTPRFSQVVLEYESAFVSFPSWSSQRANPRETVHMWMRFAKALTVNGCENHNSLFAWELLSATDVNFNLDLKERNKSAQTPFEKAEKNPGHVNFQELIIANWDVYGDKYSMDMVVFRIEEVLDGGTNLRQDTINDMDHPICGDLVPVDDSSAVHSDNLQSFENKKSDPVLIAKPPGSTWRLTPRKLYVDLLQSEKLSSKGCCYATMDKH